AVQAVPLLESCAEVLLADQSQHAGGRRSCRVPHGVQERGDGFFIVFNIRKPSQGGELGTDSLGPSTAAQSSELADKLPQGYVPFPPWRRGYVSKDQAS